MILAVLDYDLASSKMFKLIRFLHLLPKKYLLCFRETSKHNGLQQWDEPFTFGL